MLFSSLAIDGVGKPLKERPLQPLIFAKIVSLLKNRISPRVFNLQSFEYLV
jgi:hypothetical protein